MSGDRPPFLSALLVARGCPTDLWDIAASWLHGQGPVPTDPYEIVARVDEAVAIARSIGAPRG